MTSVWLAAVLFFAAILLVLLLAMRD